MDKHSDVGAYMAMVRMVARRPLVQWRHGPDASGQNRKVAWARAMKGVGCLRPDKNELGLTALVDRLSLTPFLYFKFPNEFKW
jgi:hypothetical protein